MSDVLDQFKPLIDAAIEQAKQYACVAAKEWTAAIAEAVERWFSGLFGANRLYSVTGAGFGDTEEESVECSLYGQAASPASAIPAWIVPLLLPIAKAILARLLARKESA